MFNKQKKLFTRLKLLLIQEVHSLSERQDTKGKMLFFLVFLNSFLNILSLLLKSKYFFPVHDRKKQMEHF